MSNHKVAYQKMKKYIFFLVFLLAFSIVFQGHAAAQTLPLQNITLSPVIQDITLAPGTPYTYNLEVKNNAKTPIGVHINPSSFDPDSVSSPKNPEQSLAPWISLSSQDAILDAEETKTIVVTISPPKGIKDGGYYATFIITPFIPNQKQVNTPVVLTRFVTVLFATVGKINYNNLSNKVKIDSFEIVSNVNGHMSNVSFQIENFYFTHLNAKPFLTVTPLFGKRIEFTLPEKHIFPGRNRDWNEEISIPQNHVFYSATLSISIGNGKALTKHIFFVQFPQQVIGIGICLLLILVIILGRKRIKKSMQVLIHKP